MSDTQTVSATTWLALCGCCTGHGGDPERPLEWRTVTCPECGGPCSCEGCVADALDSQPPEGPA